MVNDFPLAVDLKYVTLSNACAPTFIAFLTVKRWKERLYANR